MFFQPISAGPQPLRSADSSAKADTFHMEASRQGTCLFITAHCGKRGAQDTTGTAPSPSPQLAFWIEHFIELRHFHRVCFIASCRKFRIKSDNIQNYSKCIIQKYPDFKQFWPPVVVSSPVHIIRGSMRALYNTTVHLRMTDITRWFNGFDELAQSKRERTPLV